MARISQTFVEPIVEGSDEGRVAGVLVEAAATENPQARVAGVLAEVAATDTVQVFLTSVLVEVFLVPEALPLTGSGNPIQGENPQGARLGRQGIQGNGIQGTGRRR